MECEVVGSNPPLSVALALNLTLTLTLTWFPEGNMMHGKFLIRLQALDFTEAGVARYTSCARLEAVNGRIDCTLSFSGSCG